MVFRIQSIVEMYIIEFIRFSLKIFINIQNKTLFKDNKFISDINRLKYYVFYYLSEMILKYIY